MLRLSRKVFRHLICHLLYQVMWATTSESVSSGICWQCKPVRSECLLSVYRFIGCYRMYNRRDIEFDEFINQMLWNHYAFCITLKTQIHPSGGYNYRIYPNYLYIFIRAVGFGYSWRGVVGLSLNGGEPDQTPHSVASDLGLHCFPITLLGISRLQWVNVCTLWLTGTWESWDFEAATHFLGLPDS